MKKLIIMSVFALCSMISFAGNGQKELADKTFNEVKIENSSASESDANFNTGNVYKIDIRIFWVCSGGMSNDSFQTAIDQTACLDATQLANVKAMYLMLYQTMYPDVCNIVVYDTLLYPCN